MSGKEEALENKIRLCLALRLRPVKFCWEDAGTTKRGERPLFLVCLLEWHPVSDDTAHRSVFAASYLTGTESASSRIKHLKNTGQKNTLWCQIFLSQKLPSSGRLPGTAPSPRVRRSLPSFSVECTSTQISKRFSILTWISECQCCTQVVTRKLLVYNRNSFPHRNNFINDNNVLRPGRPRLFKR